MVDESKPLPLAALIAELDLEPFPHVPLAFAPRIPHGRSFQEILERGVAWGRR